ncbi:hypothetical protein QVD17_07736 [Tagetes erecta]|uniref:Uncharacterized protein n=1 Tax=Tagetes erecta TaxID=13708 RepID=A0AAD8NWX1_TARER|nr:hypothetical protein QVD17_07736 [Tagetes erecta]
MTMVAAVANDLGGGVGAVANGECNQNHTTPLNHLSPPPPPPIFIQFQTQQNKNYSSEVSDCLCLCL